MLLIGLPLKMVIRHLLAITKVTELTFIKNEFLSTKTVVDDPTSAATGTGRRWGMRFGLGRQTWASISTSLGVLGASPLNMSNQLLLEVDGWSWTSGSWKTSWWRETPEESDSQHLVNLKCIWSQGTYKKRMKLLLLEEFFSILAIKTRRLRISHYDSVDTNCSNLFINNIKA